MPPFIRDARLLWSRVHCVALYLAIAFGTLDINWTRVAEGLPRAEAFLGAFFPPDFVTRWDAIAEGIYESLWMTVTSTVVGILISIPVGLGAARNMDPKPVYYFCRAVLAVTHRFPEVLFWN